MISQSSLSEVMITSQIGSLISLALSDLRYAATCLVARADHDLLPFRLVGSALLRQRVAGLLDVSGKGVDMLPAQGLLDQGADQ
jgi:hypothetical protein